MALKLIKAAGDPPIAALKAIKYAYEWDNTWRYVIVRPPTKAVGFALKTFSNRHGLEVHPGIKRIMAITGHSKPTVIEAIAELRWLGFLWRIYASQGKQDHKADLYQLCLPKRLEHVPMVDAKTALEPSFHDLPPVAQRTAQILEVAARLHKGGGCPGQPGGCLRQPGVVSQDNHWWLSQTTPPTHLPKPRTNTSDHHADSSESAQASLRAREFDLSNEDDAWDFVFAAFDGDLDPHEVSTLSAMLEKNCHPHEIANTIRKLRRIAA